MGILEALFGKDDMGEGMQRLLQGEHEEAMERFTRVLERDPGNAQAWFHRGMAYLESGRPEAAIRDFTESLRRKEDPDTYYNRAMAWLDLRDLERALADLDAALRLDPEDAEAWNMRAIVEAERGDSARALQDIERAIERGHPFAGAPGGSGGGPAGSPGGMAAAEGTGGGGAGGAARPGVEEALQRLGERG
ncbi:tetratricopeptide repeat protein [Thermoflexus sp.]|uniref:tetratricopeptide repeat protein n=1 Tax=Thermoflexus sp. TaxID=1969742 RepID=UPI0017D5989F|nr:tetratricopeptide repeat protein [Thermoflexus sp.]